MYYIYPKGVMGEQLAVMMENVDGIKAEFIDDGDKALCFEAKKAQIGKDDVVYVALSKLSPHYAKNLKNIVDRLEKHKIAYVLEGVVEYIQKSLCKLKEECRNEGISKIVALVMSGFAKNKHYGRLGEALAQKLIYSERGGGIIYICSDRFSYQQYLQIKNPKIKCLYISYEFLGLLDMVDIFVLTGAYEGANGYIVQLGHGVMNYQKSEYQSYMGNALCVAGAKYLPLVDFPKEVDIVKCGYLGFDNIAGEIDRVVTKRDCVLFAPYNLSEMYAMQAYILLVLQKYKVIFRLREDFGKEGECFCQKMAKHKNFHIDSGSGFSLEVYTRAFCMVCASTSSKNSFPMITLSPVIVMPHKIKLTGLSVDEQIGINCKEWIAAEKMLGIIDKIYDSLPAWRQKILAYRDANIYNFGRASEALADYLIEKYQL